MLEPTRGLVTLGADQKDRGPWHGTRMLIRCPGVRLNYSFSSFQMKMIHIDDVFLGVMAKNFSVECSDESARFDTSYTTMLTECGDLRFCVLGSVPAKDMFYLSQNVEHLRDICNQDGTKKDLPVDLFYV